MQLYICMILTPVADDLLYFFLPLDKGIVYCLTTRILYKVIDCGPRCAAEGSIFRRKRCSDVLGGHTAEIIAWGCMSDQSDSVLGTMPPTIVQYRKKRIVKCSFIDKFTERTMNCNKRQRQIVRGFFQRIP